MAALAAATTVPAAAADFTPTPLKLEVNANDGETAARQLAMQLGFTVNLSGDFSGGLKYAGESRPYAVAVTDFLTNGGVNCEGGLNQLAPGKPLRVMPLGESAAVVLSRVSLSASANRSPNAGERTSCNYTLQMAAVLDPALQFVGVDQRVPIDTLVIDNAVVPISREGGNDPQSLSDTLGTPPAERAFSLNLNVAPTAKKITRLSARLRAWQVAEAVSVDVPADAMAAGKSSADNALTAAADYPADQRNVLTVTLTGPALDRYRAANWSNVMRRFVIALDADNRPLPAEPYNTNYDPQTKTYTLQLRPPDLASFKERLATLRVRLPTKVRCVDVPVEITDFDLPAE